MNNMKHFKDGSEVLKLAEVASYLRLGRVTAWRLIMSGQLQGFRAGRSWRVLRADLERFVHKRGRR